MTFREIISLHPHPSSLDRDALLRCIDECVDCAASCTACADACLAESDLPELGDRPDELPRALDAA